MVFCLALGKLCIQVSITLDTFLSGNTSKIKNSKKLLIMNGR
jgi:hypothetical protein